MKTYTSLEFRTLSAALVTCLNLAGCAAESDPSDDNSGGQGQMDPEVEAVGDVEGAPEQSPVPAPGENPDVEPDPEGGPQPEPVTEPDPDPIVGEDGGTATETELREFLGEFVEGKPHEANPHGVPAGYDWARQAVVGNSLTPPNNETVANWWGQVYVDESNYFAANSRVAVKHGAFLVLYKGATSWVELQNTNALEGGSWAEDFHSGCSGFNMQTESDDSRSFVPVSPGCNSHFWPALPFAELDEWSIAAIMVVAHTRLVLDDPNGVDDRSSAAYIVGLGADWRLPGGSCPQPDGSSVVICTSFGIGKHIVVGNDWRTTVFHTMDPTQVSTFPMPSLDYFRMDDDSYFH